MAEIIRVDSRNVDDVDELWGHYVPSARARRIDPKRFDFRWRSAETCGMTAVRYSLTATVDSAVQPEDQLLACRVLAGSGWVRSARTSLDAALPWATDGVQVQAHWEGTADVSAFIFDRAEAQALARRITGDDLLTLRLTDPASRDAAAGRHWNRTFDYVLSALADAEDDPITEACLVRHALVTTLSTFHSTFLDASEGEPRAGGASVVRRAIGYMDAHAHKAITVDDVAEAVHISTRGLQYAFRRGLDTTPTAYLRRVRLDGAHRDLQNATADRTVAEIARRWGFGNSSRFGELYRQTYGRSPRRTLEDR